MKIYHENDANLDILKGKTIVIVGYGSQGRNQALCLRDSGLNVILALRENGRSWKRAQEDGFDVYPIAEAVKRADIIHFLLPDDIHGQIYKEQIEPHLKEGQALSFSHGFSITYKQIIPPKGIDIFMVAPKSPGSEERRLFLEGFGVPALIAIEKNVTGEAHNLALAMAKGMGFTRAGCIDTTFKDEVETDLFGEQAVLCGGVSELMKTGFEVLVEAGYPPELAYFECINELKLIVDLVYKGGLANMWHEVSDTAEFGGRTLGSKVIGPSVKETMRELLREIQSGIFAKKWITEAKSGKIMLRNLREEEKKSLIEKTGRWVRSLYENNRKYCDL